MADTRKYFIETDINVTEGLFWPYAENVVSVPAEPGHFIIEITSDNFQTLISEQAEMILNTESLDGLDNILPL